MRKSTLAGLLLATIPTLTSCYHSGHEEWIDIQYFEPVVNPIPYNTAPILKGAYNGEKGPATAHGYAWITSPDGRWDVWDIGPFEKTTQPITATTTYTLTVKMFWSTRDEVWKDVYKTKTCEVTVTPQSTTVILPNGDQLVVGGADGEGLRTATVKVDRWNAALGSWRLTAPLHAARMNPLVTSLPDGQVLVSGGKDAAGNPITSEEIYDPTLEKWTIRE